jgi:hypothetical protein
MLIIVAVAGSIRMMFTAPPSQIARVSGRRLDQDAAQRCEALHTRMTTIAAWKPLPLRKIGRLAPAGRGPMAHPAR